MSPLQLTHLRSFDNQATNEFYVHPILCCRFLDDIFGILPGTRSQLNEFQTYLNSFIPGIKVTFTIREYVIEFLDTHVYKHLTPLGKCTLKTKMRFKKVLVVLLSRLLNSLIPLQFLTLSSSFNITLFVSIHSLKHVCYRWLSDLGTILVPIKLLFFSLEYNFYSEYQSYYYFSISMRIIAMIHGIFMLISHALDDMKLLHSLSQLSSFL